MVASKNEECVPEKVARVQALHHLQAEAEVVVEAVSANARPVKAAITNQILMIVVVAAAVAKAIGTIEVKSVIMIQREAKKLTMTQSLKLNRVTTLMITIDSKFT